VVLIHGFGASARHWRHTIPALSDQAEVIAVDLLGFGASDKPRSQLSGEVASAGSVRYCFDLWAQQLIDLLSHLQAPAALELHLVGNSIGAMVALTAARALQRQGRPPKQVVLIDCAQRTLDDKRLPQQPLLGRWLRPTLKGLVRQRWLTAALFRQLATRSTIRRVLKQAYPSGANVDDELIELLYQPTQSPGAPESFRGFINLFSDHLAPCLLQDLSAASQAGQPEVRMIWGSQDPWEKPSEAADWARRFPCIKDLSFIADAGHCPHDERPELVNPILRQWLFGAR
jgi:pimeloyl-ACP methyl ester carboxylesterase